MVLRMLDLTDDELDQAATELRARLDVLLDRDWLPQTGGRLAEVADQIVLLTEWEKARTIPAKSSLAKCSNSGLDFITHNGQEIRRATGKKPGARKRFRQHLALCGVCQIRDECLQVAETFGETIGIWGGKFPHERKPK
jgi:hypothetical protein